MSEVILNNISKTYNKGRIEAVKEVSFEVQKGELFGLIGPDGAGKTSIFRILATLLLADSGQAEVHGFDVIKDYKKIRRIAGYMPGKFSLYQDLTVEENLNFFASLFNTSVSENYELIADVFAQLEPFKKRRAANLSGGMKQKLALSCALIHNPKILLLDEPTTGIDAVSRKEFWEMLLRLKKRGITILVSTPYMDEALMCDRIALIQNGTIMSVDTPENIINTYPGRLFAIKATDMGRLLSDIRRFGNIKSCNAFGASHHITFKEAGKENQRVFLNYLSELEHTNIEIEEIKPSVEDCFIHLMSTT